MEKLEEVRRVITLVEQKGNNLSFEDKQKRDFYASFKYGLSANQLRPSEFIAVLSQHYIHGKDYFFRRYQEFFQEETVDKLYVFIEDKIFRRREY